MLLAFDPDYPVPRSDASAMSTETRSNLLPRALQPLGLTHTRAPRFAWQWAGPDLVWELVLLDEAVEEILRVPGVRGRECLATGALAQALTGGQHFHWYVQAEWNGRLVRSPLAALRFRS